MEDANAMRYERTGVVDDGLDDVRTDHAGCAIRESEQSEVLFGIRIRSEISKIREITCSPCCRNPEVRAQPSWFVRTHSTALEKGQRRRCMP